MINCISPSLLNRVRSTSRSCMTNRAWLGHKRYSTSPTLFSECGSHGSLNNKELSGFDVVLERVTNVMTNVAERQLTKVLHIGPENRLSELLGKNDYFELTGFGVSDGESVPVVTESKYRTIDYGPNWASSETSYRAHTFSMAVQCIPIDNKHHNMEHFVPIAEMARLLVPNGFLIFACTAQQWKGQKVLKEFEELASRNVGELYSVQVVDTELVDSSSVTIDKKPLEQSTTSPDTFYIALFRKH